MSIPAGNVLSISDDVHTRLREERVRLNTSQQAFALSMGIDRKTQYAYEAGTTSPNVNYLATIAEMGADVFYILTGHAVADHIALRRLPGFGSAEGPSVVVLPNIVVQGKIGPIPIGNVRWAINPSDSMASEIPKNSLVLIDVTQSSPQGIVDGGAYAYTIWGSPNIRKIHNRRDHWSLVGVGKGAEHAEVYKNDPDSGFEVLGSVICAI